MADLEVLEHLAGHSAADANDRGHAEHREHAGGALHADGDHEQRGDNQGAQSESRDGVVGGADGADQVAADGGEEESQNEHDHGRDAGGEEIAGEEEVERDHGGEGGAQTEEDRATVEVELGAIVGLGLRTGLLEVADGAADAGGEAGAHLEEGIAGADEHAAHGDRPDDVSPHLQREHGPVDDAVGRVIDGRRPEEIDDQRNQQAPGQDAAGEVQRAEARPDDVADAEIGGADGGGEKVVAAAVAMWRSALGAHKPLPTVPMLTKNRGWRRTG